MELSVGAVNAAGENYKTTKGTKFVKKQIKNNGNMDEFWELPVEVTNQKVNP